MDTRQLTNFLKIAELGSISRAADALGLAQPSLSQQIMRLEDELGAKLFRRTSRGVVTTEPGRLFVEHAQHILQTFDRAVEELAELKGEARVTVTFAMPPSIALVFGSLLVESIFKHAPRISLRLVEGFTGHILKWLEDGEIDMGILYDVSSLRHLSVKRVAHEELYLIGPPGKLGELDNPISISARQLSELRLILPGPEHGMRQLLEREAERLSSSLKVWAEVDALPQIMKLVAGGHGYTITSFAAAREDLTAKRVSAARIEEGAIRRTVCLVRNPSRTLAAVRVEEFTLSTMDAMIAKGRWVAEPDVSRTLGSAGWFNRTRGASPKTTKTASTKTARRERAKA
jgi:LysR family nitrogen assimilation transcriptional regulator